MGVWPLSTRGLAPHAASGYLEKRITLAARPLSTYVPLVPNCSTWIRQATRVLSRNPEKKAGKNFLIDKGKQIDESNTVARTK